MKNTLAFLSDLSRHNDREWFEAHKVRYREALDEFNTFAEALIAAIGTFDPATRGLKLSDCTYRIYRDVRFSHDKSPYKTHMGVYVCPGGKKSGNAGYYFHAEPVSASGGPAYFLTAGLYMPEPRFLKSIREEMIDHPEEFIAAVRQAEGFTVNEENKLKRPPLGFPAGGTMDEWLKLKDVCLERPVDERMLLRPDPAEWVAGEFRKTYPFNALLNKAVSFAREEG